MTIAIAIVIILLIYWVYSKKRIISKKGKDGEWLIAEELLKVPGTTVFTNVYLPLNKQRTKFTEVDIIAVNKAGIYIVESKNYGGKITGNLDDHNWIQYIGKQINKFYSPIKQNDTHFKALTYQLPNYIGDMKPLVVFGDRADISDLKKSIKAYRVINTSEVYDVVSNDLKNCYKGLKASDGAAICEVLRKFSHVSNKVKRKHLRNVKRKH